MVAKRQSIAAGSAVRRFLAIRAPAAHNLRRCANRRRGAGMQSSRWGRAPVGVLLTLAALLAAALGGRALMGPPYAAQAASTAGAPAEPPAPSLGLIPDAASAPLDGLALAPRAVAGQSTVRLEQVAHDPLGASGLEAGIWLHHGFAYVGTWASGSDRQRGCPGAGVKIVDLRDPTQPTLLGSVAEHPGTSAEVMRVRSVSTPSFQGDLLAV